MSRCLIRLWLDEILFGHWNGGMPYMPASKAEQTDPEDELKNRGDRIALLPADLLGRIRGATSGAGESRRIYLMFTSTAGYERHAFILV